MVGRGRSEEEEEEERGFICERKEEQGGRKSTGAKLRGEWSP